MSDTDDTDDLLLIPPDFFLVHSEPEPPYYSIVDSLIKQVSNLQNRIETIETTSDVSLVGSNLEHSIESQPNTVMFNLNRPPPRRYLSHDDLYQTTSIQSTPQKPNTKIRLNSLPNSPNIDRFSPRKSSVKFARSPQRSYISNVPQKPAQDTEVLQEIDTFISNVKTIQRNHAVRNLQNDLDECQRTAGITTPNKNSVLGPNAQPHDTHVHETIDQLDRRSQKIMEDRKKLEREHVNMNNDMVSERINRDSTWNCGDNVGSVPNYDTGVRDTLYKQKEAMEPLLKSNQIIQNYQPTSSSTDFTSYTTFDKSADSSSDSTQLTACNKYKNQDEWFGIDQKYNQFQNEQKVNQKFNDVFKVDRQSTDVYKVDQERNELLHSPLHDTALTVLDMHKKLLESTNTAVKDGRVQKKRGINTLSDTFGLLSLADIWGSGHLSQSPSKITQKLQEEKLRRQHCEQLIRDLQNKNLELQQKLAVAVKVDESKNNTIQQFREALEKVSLRMEKLNEEKSTWDREITVLKSQHSVEIESANQKIIYYEKEASKALNIAHTNQEKISLLEKRCSDLQNEIESIETKFKEVEESYQKEIEKNKQLADIVSQKEIELKENRIVLNSARDEVSQSRKAVEICQSEFTALKSESAKLQSESKEEKNVIMNLSEQKRKLLNDVQTYKTNEKSLKEALEQCKAKVDSTKVELRNFYQGQLEIIVENKRKEMQSQLDAERQHILEDLNKKEMSIAKTAANHIKQISDKCALETKLLEQKQLEEIRLYQMQLSKYKTEIDTLQAKLANLPEKRAQIAKQLQKVMETQWNEAIKMINGSPASVSSEQQSLENLNSLQSKATYPKTAHEAPKLPRVSDNCESDYDETPVSSRGGKHAEGEIQKYINMLLNRPPGNPAPTVESQEGKRTWHPGDQESQNKADITRLPSKERKSDKPPWK